MHALQQARREVIGMAWDIYPRSRTKGGRCGAENIHSKVELIIELKPGTRPTQKMSMDLPTVMAAEFSCQIKSTQLYNCSTGGRRCLKPEVKNCSKRRNAPGSRKLGCQATMHTKLLQLSSGQMVLEVQIPTLKTHLSTHDPKSIFDELLHEPLPEIEEKVYSLVQGAYLTQMALILSVRDWVKKELIPKHLREGVITTAPSDNSRAYFPTKEDIRYMARRAIVQQRSSLLDQDAVENYLRETKEHQELDFYLHKYKVSPKG